MTASEVANKIKELGYTSTNIYPKKTFLVEGEVVIGLYKRELEEDFFWFNTRDEILYKVPKPPNLEAFKQDPRTDKYLIPLEYCEAIWEDKPYEELPDAPYKDMTLRQYACIQMRVPASGLPWLDELIKQVK